MNENERLLNEENKMHNVIRILGYDRDANTAFCKRSGIRSGKFSFVNKADDLRGTRNALIILVDGWENRRDRSELEKMMVDRESICLSPMVVGDSLSSEEHF